MTILKRFRLGQAVVSIMSVSEQTVIEIVGCNSPEHERSLQQYLVNEGIFEATLQGKRGLEFDSINAETLMAKSND